jgi:hypothetical protein
MTSTATTSTVGETTRLATRQKVGLGLATFYAVLNLPSVFFVPDTGDDAGPPFGIMLLDTVLAAIALVACVLAFRGSRRALRLAAGCLILITLTSLPALFVDIPMGIKATVAFGVILTVVFVVLMFSGPRRAAAAGR